MFPILIFRRLPRNRPINEGNPFPLHLLAARQVEENVGSRRRSRGRGPAKNPHPLWFEPYGSQDEMTIAANELAV
jgi:hypothetical protein